MKLQTDSDLSGHYGGIDFRMLNGSSSANELLRQEIDTAGCGEKCLPVHFRISGIPELRQ